MDYSFFIALFTLITACATSFRAYNSRKDVKMREKELNLKTAATRLHYIQVKKKVGAEHQTEFEEISKLIGD